VAAFIDARITLPIYEALFSAAATVFAIAFSVVQQRTVQNEQLGSLVGVTSTLCAAAIVSSTLLTSILVGTVGIFYAILLGCSTASLGVIALVALVASGRAGALQVADETPGQLAS
jgi:hypothetical protein